MTNDLIALLSPITSAAGNPRGESMTFDLEVVTPMFLAGAKNKATNDRDEPGEGEDIDREYLRPTSVKSMLRWWWRAVAPHHDAASLHDAEGAIFGDTKHGQGLSVTTQHHEGWKCGIDSMPTSVSLGYLLGQGLNNFRNGVVRPAAYPGSKAKVTIKGHLNQDVKNAVTLFSLLGGLGSRSRRGWGSVSSTAFPKDLDDLRARLNNLMKIMPTTPRSWSHLTPNTRYIVIPSVFPTWNEALDALGTPMAEMRQKLGGRQSPYGPDHDLVSKLVHENSLPRNAPQRSVFGLPHPYRFKSSGNSIVFKWNGSERRASPLLLHVAKLQTGGFAAIAIVMSGPFLPPGSTITTDRNRRVSVPPPSMALLDEYLDRISGKV